MESRLRLDILPQPDDTTCGPTCLHALYRYYGDEVPLAQVISEARALEEGGTLAVFLACHALRHGFHATIYTYNMQVFDPTWFGPEAPDLRERLQAQQRYKETPKLRVATQGYLEFLGLGGRIRFEDLTTGLIRRYLRRGVPLLTGLSATYLYRSAREFGPRSDYDDLRGEPSGHFVVLSGYETQTRAVLIADPLHPNPLAPSHYYTINIERVIGAILLGVLTHDANLLVIEPKKARRSAPHADSHHRQ